MCGSKEYTISGPSGSEMFVIGFENEERRKQLEETEWKWLGQWFEVLSHWGPEYVMEERIVELQILGLPILFWNKQNLEKIAELWGYLLMVECNLTNPNDVRVCTITVVTRKLEKIDEIIEVRQGNFKSAVRVIETGKKVQYVDQWFEESMRTYNPGVGDQGVEARPKKSSKNSDSEPDEVYREMTREEERWEEGSREVHVSENERVEEGMEAMGSGKEQTSDDSVGHAQPTNCPNIMAENLECVQDESVWNIGRKSQEHVEGEMAGDLGLEGKEPSVGLEGGPMSADVGREEVGLDDVEEGRPDNEKQLKEKSAKESAEEENLEPEATRHRGKKDRSIYEIQAEIWEEKERQRRSKQKKKKGKG